MLGGRAAEDVGDGAQNPLGRVLGLEDGDPSAGDGFASRLQNRGGERGERRRQEGTEELHRVCELRCSLVK